MTAALPPPRQRSPVRRALPWFLLFMLAAAGGGAWWYTSRTDGLPKFRTARIERGTIVAVVSSSGTLNAVTTVQVSSQVSGQVKEIYADFNTPVKKDQLIARLDPESFELKVKQSQAEVDAARTNLLNQRSNVLVLESQVTRAKIALDDAARQLERNQSLYDKGFISVAELDKTRFARDAAAEAQRTAEAQVKVGEAQVANADAVLRQKEIALAGAKVDLGRTAIRAPVDGVVISRNVDAGQTVAASLQAPTLFTIAQDLREMQVDTSIDESDIGRIRLEQPASFTVDAFPGRNFRGAVRQIRKAAQTVQNVVTYTVVIGAANPDLLLVPGMTANVRITTDSRENVLKIPNSALRYRPPNVDGTGIASGSATADGPKAGGAADGKGGAGGGPGFGGAGGGGGGGGGDVQARRQRLAAELKLDAAQQARLDEIFAEQRQKFVELRDVPEADRRIRAERMRADVRQQINAMLNPEQQKHYADIVAQETGRGTAGSGTGRVWIVGDAGRPLEVAIRTGLTDGNATELLSGSLKEGSEVIVGNVERAGTASSRPSSGGAPRLPF